MVYRTVRHALREANFQRKQKTATRTDRREAENDVQVVARAGEEVVHDVLGRGRPPRVLALHHGDQLAYDLALFVAVEQVAHHTWGRPLASGLLNQGMYSLLYTRVLM